MDDCFPLPSFLPDDDALLADVLSPDFMSLLEDDAAEDGLGEAGIAPPSPALSGCSSHLQLAQAPMTFSSARTSHTGLQEPSSSNLVMIPQQQHQPPQATSSVATSSVGDGGISVAVGAPCSRAGSPMCSNPNSGSTTSALRPQQPAAGQPGSTAALAACLTQPAAAPAASSLFVTPGCGAGVAATPALQLAGTTDSTTAAAVSSAILLLQQQHQQQLLRDHAATQQQMHLPARQQHAYDSLSEEDRPLTKQQLAALKRKAPEVDWRAISDPEERRKQRRLAKNRITAARSRERKKEQMAGMEGRLAAMEADNVQLRGLLAALATENSSLKEQLASLTRGASLLPAGTGNSSSSTQAAALLLPGAAAAIKPEQACNNKTNKNSSSPVCPEPAVLNRCLANMHLVALALLFLACSVFEASLMGGGITSHVRCWQATLLGSSAACAAAAAAVGDGVMSSAAVVARGRCGSAGGLQQQLLLSRSRLKAWQTWWVTRHSSAARVGCGGLCAAAGAGVAAPQVAAAAAA